MAGKSVVVGIHQPNFLPWLGFFDKVARSDIFIILDHVQYPKSGGCWTNRVKLLFVDGNAKWVTVPLRRSGTGFQDINKVTIDNSKNWQQKLLKTLQRNYSRTPYYRETISFLEPLILNRADNLSEYNISSILALKKALNISSECIVSSEYNPSGSSNEMLISLIREVCGTEYLCGDGAYGYIREEMFAASGIRLTYQNFIPAVYPQVGVQQFIPGLSIIDALMNVGFEGVKQLINVRQQ